VPGMADELLAELAPYLLDDGIDLRTTTIDDLSTLNAALGRALERRNAAILTPSAEQRSYATTLLRLVTEALYERNRDVAQAIVWSVPAEVKDGEGASVAHVISTGLDLLDRWMRDDARRDAVIALRLAPWSREAHAAANSVVEAADTRDGAAAQVGRLIATHGGLALLEGVAIAVSGSVHADARLCKRSLAESIGTMLNDDRFAGTS